MPPANAPLIKKQGKQRNDSRGSAGRSKSAILKASLSALVPVTAEPSAGTDGGRMKQATLQALIQRGAKRRRLPASVNPETPAESCGEPAETPAGDAILDEAKPVSVRTTKRTTKRKTNWQTKSKAGAKAGATASAKATAKAAAKAAATVAHAVVGASDNAHVVAAAAADEGEHAMLKEQADATSAEPGAQVEPAADKAETLSLDNGDDTDETHVQTGAEPVAVCGDVGAAMAKASLPAFGQQPPGDDTSMAFPEEVPSVEPLAQESNSQVASADDGARTPPKSPDEQRRDAASITPEPIGHPTGDSSLEPLQDSGQEDLLGEVRCNLEHELEEVIMLDAYRKCHPVQHGEHGPISRTDKSLLDNTEWSDELEQGSVAATDASQTGAGADGGTGATAQDVEQAPEQMQLVVPSAGPGVVAQTADPNHPHVVEPVGNAAAEQLREATAAAALDASLNSKSSGDTVTATDESEVAVDRGDVKAEQVPDATTAPALPGESREQQTELPQVPEVPDAALASEGVGLEIVLSLHHLNGLVIILKNVQNKETCTRKSPRIRRKDDENQVPASYLDTFVITYR